MNHRIVFFDDNSLGNIYPFDVLHDRSDVPIAVHTIAEKWQRCLKLPSVHLNTLKSISELKDNVLCILSNLLPDTISSQCLKLGKGQALIHQGQIIACSMDANSFAEFYQNHQFPEVERIPVNGPRIIMNSIQLLELFPSEMLKEIRSIGKENHFPDTSGQGNLFYGEEGIYIDPSAELKGVHIDATDGPVYIGASCKILPGVNIKGPVYLGPGCIVLMGASVYGPSCFGPKCVINGEVKRSYFIGYCNKSHDGYIGDSILGSYVNLGALTTNSNLKNNFTSIWSWDPSLGDMIDSGRNKLGVLIGDYTCTGILSKMPAGMVAGVCCNLVSNDFLPKYVPSFSWLINQEITMYEKRKMLDTVKTLHEWKGEALSEKVLYSLHKAYENALIP